MTETLGRMTDRLLSVFVPKTTAGACACNDYVCTNYYCADKTKKQLCHWNCDCSKRTCSPCRTNC